MYRARGKSHWKSVNTGILSIGHGQSDSRLHGSEAELAQLLFDDSYNCSLHKRIYTMNSVRSLDVSSDVCAAITGTGSLRGGGGGLRGGLDEGGPTGIGGRQGGRWMS